MSDRALLIGINVYQSVPGLRGCVPDTTDVYALLTETVGFAPGSIEVLADATADGRNVRAALERLRADAVVGDRRILAISSHGSYTVDTSGDEADNKDELICLHDMDWSDARTYLLDDEMGRYVASLAPGVSLTILLDCCHSGTGTREITPPGMPVTTASARDPSRRGPLVVQDATAARARAAGSGIAPERQPYVSPYFVQARFAAPPPEIQARVRSSSPTHPRVARAVAEAPVDAVLWAACRADQTAADAYLGGGYRGAFTEAWARNYRRLAPAFPRGVPRSRLFVDVARTLRAGRFPQEPQLEHAGTRGVALGPQRRSP